MKWPPVREKMLAKLSIGAVTLTLALLSTSTLQAIPLYSFGPDNMNDPRSFTAIDTLNSTSQPLYNMNDLNDGFNGGVTYRGSDNLFYAIFNDSSGNSSLISFGLGAGGAFNTLQTIGAGFFGGLAFDKADGNFYGIGLDSLGNSTLYKIALGGPTTSVLSLGSGFNGGLTFDSSDGNLYAISNDSQGNSTLNRISLALGGSVTALSGGLGAGFLGGVAYDGASNSFYAIANDVLGNSSLNQIVVSGSSVVSEASLFTVGSGFVNAGLAGADTVPEPSTLWLFASGILIVVGRCRGRQPRQREGVSGAISISEVSNGGFYEQS
jgi:PEP-CTERM motif